MMKNRHDAINELLVMTSLFAKCRKRASSYSKYTQPLTEHLRFKGQFCMAPLPSMVR